MVMIRTAKLVALLGGSLLLAAGVLCLNSEYGHLSDALVFRSSVTDRTLPPFRLPSLAGGTLAASALEGETHLLFLGDPACSACDESYPELERARSLISVVYVASGDRDDIGALVSENRWDFHVVFDSTGSVAAALGIPGVPGAAFVGPDLTVTRVARGSYLTRAFLRHVVLRQKRQREGQVDVAQ